MKLYIPEIGDQIKLIADWTFDLYNEDRNTTLMKKVNDTREVPHWNQSPTAITCTIPAGSILKIDRIYIRKGQEDFNSITFFWVGEHIPAHSEEITYPAPREQGLPDRTIRTGRFVNVPKRPVRFWVKMDDANKIEFEQV